MADQTGCDSKEKSLYLSQICFLDEQLERFQLKCDELEKRNKALSDLCSRLEEDMLDITNYLKHSAAEKEKEAEQLVELLENQQQEAGQIEEALKLQHTRELEEMQEQIKNLRSLNRTQALKQEEHKEQVEELRQRQPDTKSLRRQLFVEMKLHEAAVLKLRQEIKLEKLKLVRGSRQKVKRCLEMKMPEILQEKNEHLEQLEKVKLQLSESQVIWEEKQTLQTKARVIRFNMEDRKKTLREVRRVLSNQETGNEELKKKTQQLKTRLKELNSTREQALAEVEALRQNVALASEEHQQKSEEVDELRAEMQKERSRRTQLEDDVQEAAVLLRHVLKESEETPKTQQKMQRLLKSLEKTNHQGRAPTPDNPTEKSGRGQKPHISSPKPTRAETLDLATDPLFLMSRYRRGDLGFVPRAMWRRRPGLNPRPSAPSDCSEGKKMSSSEDQCGPGPQLSDSGVSTSTDHLSKPSSSPQPGPPYQPFSK